MAELIMTDSHGQERVLRPAGDTSVPPAGTPDFAVFVHSTTAADLPMGTAVGLFLPAASVAAQRSSALKTVLLLRDDIADLAWALETVVQSDDGETLDRVSAAHAARKP